MATLNLKFADGNELLSYDEDTHYESGCPTCNYDSKYINYIEIYTTNYHISIKLCQMYEYAFSTADAIKIFAVKLDSMTEEEFIEHVSKRIHEYDALEQYNVTKNITLQGGINL